jgi:hypothetical protein
MLETWPDPSRKLELPSSSAVAVLIAAAWPLAAHGETQVEKAKKRLEAKLQALAADHKKDNTSRSGGNCQWSKTIGPELTRSA